MTLLYEEITNKILAACFEVSTELGAGFLESVYQNALMIALQEKGLTIEREYPLEVSFRGQIVGQFYADILVEGKIILELKAVSVLSDIHKAQVINYLKATGIEVGLLVNFGSPKVEYRRFDNRFKKEQRE
ncbi:MAG: GxxExxY protein [Anaerolineaceae bacterium]|jgi:GxxExxY protein